MNFSPQTVEESKRAYLAQFAHVGCGGAPVAIPAKSMLGCSVCKIAWSWVGTIGSVVNHLIALGELRSMVAK